MSEHAQALAGDIGRLNGRTASTRQTLAADS
jgi:hypothetical protein